MKLDILDVLSRLKKEFGNETSATFFNDEDAIRVRLSVYHNDEWCRTEFMMPHHEMVDELVSTMNLRFKSAMEELKHFIEEHDEN